MSSKKKEKKESKKEEKKKKSSKSKNDEESPLTETVEPTKPTVVEPEAFQLFQRYDNCRDGSIKRQDFQRLIYDINHIDYSQHPRHFGMAAIHPLALTDVGSATPLGYQRTTKNSEFEAGQLFERYDKEHLGRLSKDQFQSFFADFREQLLPFIQELNFQSQSNFAKANYQMKNGEPPNYSPQYYSNETTNLNRNPAMNGINRKILESHKINFAKLRSVFKYYLVKKREEIVEMIDELENQIRELSKPTNKNSRADNILKSSQLQESIMEYEQDIQSIDMIGTEVEINFLEGNQNNFEKIEAFTKIYPQLYSTATKLSKKVLKNKTAQNNRNFNQAAEDLNKRYEIAVKMLKVKDQVIYELIQERNHLTKEHQELKSDMECLRQCSTDEIRKWAKLTDDMAEQLQYANSFNKANPQQK